MYQVSNGHFKPIKDQAGFILRVVRKNSLIKTMLGQQGYFNF